MGKIIYLLKHLKKKRLKSLKKKRVVKKYNTNAIDKKIKRNMKKLDALIEQFKNKT